MVRAGLLAGLLAQGVLLAALRGAAGVHVVAVVVALAYAVGMAGLLARRLARAGARRLGSANGMTLLRAVLVGGVVALVVDSFRPVGPASPAHGTVIAVLAAVALALDGVDGRIARRTGTVSALGARFDVEVDSVLVFALAVEVARSLGAWVLLIGSVHYLLLLAAAALPWLQRPAPPRPWCKVVAAVQGIVLGAVATGVLPDAVARGMLIAVAALLAESFGREVWWLWLSRGRQVRHGLSAPVPDPAYQPTIG